MPFRFLMADNALTIGAMMDVGELKAGFDESVNVTQQSVSKISIQFQEASVASTRAIRAISDETKKMAISVGADFQRVAQATVANAAAQKEVRAALTLTKDASIDAAESANLLAAAQEKAAAVALELAAANEAAGLSEQHHLSDVQAISGGLRTMEGTALRAAERFAAFAGLGPLFQTLFPVLGAIAFAEILVKVGGQLSELKDKMQGLTDKSKTFYQQIVEDSHKAFIEVSNLADGHRNLNQLNAQASELAARRASLQAAMHDLEHESIIGAIVDRHSLNKVIDQENAVKSDQIALHLRMAKLEHDQSEEQKKQAEQAKKDAEAAAKQHEADLEQRQRDLVKFNSQALLMLRERARAEDEATRHSRQVMDQGVNDLMRDLEKEAKAAEELQKRKIRSAELTVDGQVALEQQQIAADKQNADFLYSTHQISFQKRLDLIRSAIAKERQLELQQLQFKLQLAKLDTNNPEQVQRIENQIALIKQKYRQQELTLDQQAVQHKQQIVQQSLAKINSAFDATLSGYLSGTQSLGQAWSKTFDSMVITSAKSLEQMLAQWILHHEEKKSISLLTALKELTHHAMNAAAGAYEAVVQIPIIGPALAPPAAAVAFAGVEALGALASASNGMVSTDEQMAFIHKNEMVLPASLSLGFQSIIGRMSGPAQAAQGDGGSSFTNNGGIHVHGADANRKLGSDFWYEFKKGVRLGKHRD
jgi:hypothetical protein